MKNTLILKKRSVNCKRVVEITQAKQKKIKK